MKLVQVSAAALAAMLLRRPAIDEPAGRHRPLRGTKLVPFFGCTLRLPLFATVLPGVAVLLVGCASATFHSLTFDNRSSKPVREVELVCGTRVIPFVRVFGPRSEATYAGDFVVPSELTLRWESMDGTKMHERVPFCRHTWT